MDPALDELLAFTAYPREIWRQIWSNNPQVIWSWGQCAPAWPGWQNAAPARDAVDTAAGQVIDKELRRLLEVLVAAYDHAKAAAQPAQPLDPEWQLRAPFRIAVTEINPASPHHQLKALPGETLERIHFLERKAAAY